MDKVFCPFCDKGFSVLWPHLNGKHGITDMSKFKTEYPNVELVSESFKSKQYHIAVNRGFGKSNLGKTLTKEHRAKIGRAGDKNPFYGMKHTEETRKKMRENHADFTGENNPLAKWLKENPDKQDCYALRMVAQWQKFKEDKERYEQYCNLRSAVSTQLLLDGKVTTSKHRSGQFFSKRQDKYIIYRSSYEHKFLSKCENDASILAFDSCHFSIPYVFDRKQKRYIPDFKINYLDGSCVLVEVKPSWRITEPQNIEKFIAANQFCENEGCIFLLVTESDLFASLADAVSYSKSLIYEKTRIVYEEIEFES